MKDYIMWKVEGGWESPVIAWDGIRYARTEQTKFSPDILEV